MSTVTFSKRTVVDVVFYSQVCTGVFNPDAALPIEQGTADAELMEPDYIVEDVEAAIDLIFQKEGFDL